MFRVIKMLFLVVFFAISVIGFLVSTFAYFGILLFGENALPLWIFSVLFGIPIVFIPAILIGIVKTARYKGKEYRYGIRFWAAIKNIPNQLAMVIYVLGLNVVIMILLYYYGYGKDSLVLSSGMMLFYYIPFMIYLSSLKR